MPYSDKQWELISSHPLKGHVLTLLQSLIPVGSHPAWPLSVSGFSTLSSGAFSREKVKDGRLRSPHGDSRPSSLRFCLSLQHWSQSGTCKVQSSYLTAPSLLSFKSGLKCHLPSNAGPNQPIQNHSCIPSPACPVFHPCFIFLQFLIYYKI